MAMVEHSLHILVIISTLKKLRNKKKESDAKKAEKYVVQTLPWIKYPWCLLTLSLHVPFPISLAAVPSAEYASLYECNPIAHTSGHFPQALPPS